MAQPRDPVAVGVIGAGFMSQVAHLPAFAGTNGCRLAALADNRADLLEAVGPRFGIGKRMADYRELLADSAVEAVVVSMPRRAQSAVVRDVLEAGRPVFTEKPMAFTAATAAALASLAESRGVPLAVGYMRRHDAGVALFRSLLAEALAGSVLGALRHVRMTDFCGAYPDPVPEHVKSAAPRPFRYPEDPTMPEFLDPELGGEYDYTVNVASHDIDLLRHLLGDPLEPVSFRVRPGEGQEAVLAAREAEVELSVAPLRLGRWEQRLDAEFTKGRLSLILAAPLGGAGATVIRETSIGEEVMPAPKSEGGAFARQAAAFLESLGGGAPHAAGGRDAARDAAVIESLWRIASIA